jgi:hypothetical protein
VGGALAFDVRHDRWSFLFDGMYVKLSAGGDPPGPLYESASMDFQQAFVQGAVAYRVVEGKRGWLEVFAGVRWNYMGADFNMVQDSGGIAGFSSEVSDQAVNRAAGVAQEKLEAIAATVKQEVESKLEEALQPKLSQAESRLKNGIMSKVQERLQGVLGRLPEKPGHGLPGNVPGLPPGFSPAIAEKAQAYAEAVVAQKVAEARAALDAVRDAVKVRVAEKAQRAVARAKQQLASTIEHELRQRLPTSASNSVNWLDPIIGIRARYNMSDSLFLKLYGDVGGFGAGSELTWQYYAGLGWQASKNGSLEIGWRQNYNDYTNGDFIYKASMYGPYAAFAYRF